MKNKRILIPILVLLSIWSCQEDELVLRTNPRFSEAEIVENTTEGARFRSEVYDLGSEEIIEYGFLVSEEEELSLENWLKLAEQGSPTGEFSFVQDRFLRRGKRYFVKPFMTIASGTVYSQTVDFVSLGSKGFNFQELSGTDEPVYFGDTLEVSGEGIYSFNEKEVSVLFEGAQAEVFEIRESGFKFKIPLQFEPRPGQFIDGTYKVDIQVGDYKFPLDQKLQFRNPTFEVRQDLNYSDKWTIKGDYLFSNEYEVTYLGGGETPMNLEVLSIEDSEISFVPKADFTELNPIFELKIRGQKYRTDQIHINPTFFEEGQVISLDQVFGFFELRVKNFNYLVPSANQFFVEGDEGITISGIREFEGKIHFDYLLEKPIESRELRFTSKVAGFTSSVDFEVESPFLPFSRRTIVPDFPYDNSMSVQTELGSKTIGKDGIYSYDFTGEEFVKEWDFDFEGGDFLYAFPKENKVFLLYRNSSGLIKLLTYDPKTKSAGNAESVPIQGELLGVFQAGLNFYFTMLETTDEGNFQKRVKFDYLTKSWSVESISGDIDQLRLFSFEYEGDDYVVGRDPLADYYSQFGLYRVNADRQSWTLLKPLDQGYGPSGYFLVGDQVIYFRNQDLFKLNLKSFDQTQASAFLPLYQIGMIVDSKIYFAIPIGDWEGVWEFDPEFFK